MRTLVIGALLTVTAGAAGATPRIDLPSPTYWVRRIAADGPVVRSSSADQGYVETTTVFTVECVRIIFERRDGHDWFRLGELSATFDAAGTFTALRSDRAAPPIALEATCSGELPRTPAVYFRDEASCRAAPATVTQRCVGACRYDGDPPFTLGGCQPALAIMAAAAAPIVDASTAQRARTAARLAQLIRRGGRVWTVVPDDALCRPMQVRPADDGAVELRQEFRGGDGLPVAYLATMFLEPQTAHAYVDTEEGGRGGGRYGRLGYTAGLYQAADHVLLGDRRLFFTRAACRAAPPLGDVVAIP